MARIKGKDGVVQFGATPTAVGEVRQFAINHSIAELDASTMGNDYTEVDGGQKSWDVSATILFDPADDGQDEIVLGGKVAGVYLPAGTATGSPRYSGTALITSANLTGSHDGLWEYAITGKGDGALTIDTVPAPPTPPD